MQIEAFRERETLILKPRIYRRQLGGLMFSRKKKGNDDVGVVCPYCGVNNPLGSEQCQQCYYSLNVSAREQPMAAPSSTADEIMSLLLGENEEEEDEGPVVEAVLSMDDVMVEVDQYAVSAAEQDADGEPVPDSFDFIGSEGPTLSSTVESSEPDEVELTADDAPKKYIEFELTTVDPLDEVAEPVHTGRGGLYSPTVKGPKDDDLLGEVGPAPAAVPDLPDLPDDPPLASASLAQAVAAEVPELPDLPDEAPTGEAQTNAVSLPESAMASTPTIPDLPGDEVEAPTPAVELPVESPTPASEHRIWPWPKSDPWAPTKVYQEVVSAMEHIKHGRMEAAANTLDGLGPHLEENLDMLLHISVLMQHLGRQEHMKWTLDMAAFVHPNDPHVQQARAQLLV
ncbi:MAG TPA: hypothetical protein D7H91_00720 [Candidatus Poseidoniales archaeon]|nr:MAG TPA: hypothetical protein D7H91_00720 [Candidatus Poseidoniales archaeon]